MLAFNSTTKGRRLRKLLFMPMVTFQIKERYSGQASLRWDRDEFERFKENNISILGVSYDSENALRSFKKKHELNFDLLSDSDKIMGNSYGVNKFYFFPSRKTFLIDERGRLVHVFDEVDLHTHPDDILKFFNHK